MIQKYHEPIFNLLTQKGALGVNTIAKETGIALSTVQKYLTTQQSYFRKNEDRKWDLPERVKTDISEDTSKLTLSILENSLLINQKHLGEALNAVDNSLKAISTIKAILESKPPSVADTSPKITNKKLLSIIDTTDRLPEVIKARKSFIPDEYYQVLIKTSWLDLILDLGDTYVNDVIQPELYELLSGSKTELDEDLVNVLKNYQT